MPRTQESWSLNQAIWLKSLSMLRCQEAPLLAELPGNMNWEDRKSATVSNIQTAETGNSRGYKTPIHLVQKTQQNINKTKQATWDQVAGCQLGEAEKQNLVTFSVEATVNIWSLSSWIQNNS